MVSKVGKYDNISAMGRWSSFSKSVEKAAMVLESLITLEQKNWESLDFFLILSFS